TRGRRGVAPGRSADAPRSRRSCQPDASEGHLHADRSMEPLWSPVVATRGNQRQIDGPPKPQKRAKSVASGCDRLRATFHGKEGVDGSSPSEGSAKAPHVGAFLFSRTCTSSHVRWVW